MLTTTAWIVGIALFSTTGVVAESGVFVALNDASPFARELWGVIGLGVVIGNLITVIFRKPWLSKVVAFTGFALWVFASIALVLNFDWFMLLVAGLPHLMFWVWYYLETLRYEQLYHKTK